VLFSAFLDFDLLQPAFRPAWLMKTILGKLAVSRTASGRTELCYS
jgi:hypothetical protein